MLPCCQMLPLAKCCLTPALLVFRERSWSRTQMRVLHILNTSLLKCGLHTRQYFVFRCLLDFERICLTTESVNRCQPTGSALLALGFSRCAITHHIAHLRCLCLCCSQYIVGELFRITHLICVGVCADTARATWVAAARILSR